MGGGRTENEGYIEALGSNDEWGGVCDDHWDINDGKVVCKMLGYPTAETIFHDNPRFGQAPSGGRFVLDNLNCTGNESSVFDCPHNGEWNENCRAHEIAGVRCGNETKTESEFFQVFVSSSYTLLLTINLRSKHRIVNLFRINVCFKMSAPRG